MLEQPTTALMPAPFGEHKILADVYRDDSGEPCARPLRQLVLRNASGDLIPVPWPRAWGVDQIKSALDQRGLGDAELVELYLEDDEELKSFENRTQLTEVFGKFGAQAYGGRGGDRKVRPIALKAGLSRRYLRGLAKMAFHYFLWASPILRGDEQCFDSLRAFIRRDHGEWKDFVELDAPHFLPLLNPGSHLS